MSIQDPLGDMLTRIRNAQERGKSKVNCPASKLRFRVLDVLKQEAISATIRPSRWARRRPKSRLN